jgi:circadian clock protein KaiC
MRETGNLCKSGVDGLDNILSGGFPPNRMYLLQGPPGSGKTTLAMQFLLTGLAAGERSLYISLSETRDEIEEMARSHRWSLDGLEIVELSAIDSQLSAEAQNTLFHSSEVELTQTTKLLLEAVDRVRPARLAFDSLSELRLLSDTALRYRRQILAFKQYLAGRNCTSLLLDDTTATQSDLHVESLAHGVLKLEQISPDYGNDRRRLLVKKVRGKTYRGGYHDFVIATGGLLVFPRLVAAEHHREFPNENVSSGVEGLDELLGGGLGRGTNTLFIGPPGSGKSTLAFHFAVALAHRGERAGIYSFDENLEVTLARAEGVGLGFRELVESKKIILRQIDPADLSPGQFASQVRQGVEEDGIRLVVIDSLNGYLQSITSGRALNLQLHELLSYLNQQGVVTILVVAQHGWIGQMQTPVDVTYLADTVLTLRFYEAFGAVHKAIAVVKKRTGAHETTIRELIIDAHGVSVGPPLQQFRGLLTGTPEELKRKKGSSSRQRPSHERG